MGISHFLESLPMFEIIKVTDGPPKNAVSFTGHPRQIPSEKSKVILINDPLGDNPAIIEFNLDDVVFVEDLHALITEKGESLRLVKIWIRKGARGVIFEPFVVDKPLSFADKSKEIQKRFSGAQEMP